MRSRKVLASAAVFAGLAIPGIALAATASAGPGNCTGSACYYANPGRQQAISVGAQNGTGAASGAFGAFTGPGLNFSGGADGYQTGLSNSAVAGNRQGNLP